MSLDEQMQIIRRSFQLKNFYTKGIELTYIFPLIYLVILITLTTAICILTRIIKDCTITKRNTLESLLDVSGATIGYIIVSTTLLYLVNHKSYLYYLYITCLSILYLPVLIGVCYIIPFIESCLLLLCTLLEFRFMKECMNYDHVEFAGCKKWFILGLLGVMLFAYFDRILRKLTIESDKQTNNTIEV